MTIDPGITHEHWFRALATGWGISIRMRARWEVRPGTMVRL